MKIGIIDYGCGNTTSLVNAFSKIGYDVSIIDNATNVEKFSIVVLPGVGSFGYAAKKLTSLGFKDALNGIQKRGETLIIGICLGMQLMCNGSEEGNKEPGLGWVDANVVRFDEGNDVRIPHMGWNSIEVEKSILSEFNGVDFYFVHSYRVVLNDCEGQLAKTDYNGDFSSIIYAKNAIGMQFHPEKSHNQGLKLLKSIIENKDELLKAIDTEKDYVEA